MKNLTNKNKIYVALFVLVLVFSFASPSYARTVTVETGAKFTAENVNQNDLTNTKTEVKKETTTKKSDTVDLNKSALSASAIFGESGIFRSALMWGFLTLLIIIATITWRKATRTKAEEHAPLKHA